jgi:hypothetical protein
MLCPSCGQQHMRILVSQTCWQVRFRWASMHCLPFGCLSLGVAPQCIPYGLNPAAKAADIGSARTGLRLGGAAHSSIGGFVLQVDTFTAERYSPHSIEGTSHQVRVVVLELSLFLLGSQAVWRQGPRAGMRLGQFMVVKLLCPASALL